MVEKEVLIVVNDKDRITLKGEELKVHNKRFLIDKDELKVVGLTGISPDSQIHAPTYLVVTVRDENDNNREKTIALFREWRYWRELPSNAPKEEITEMT